MAVTAARVFPTRVGVNRRDPTGSRLYQRFPHTRGGEPTPLCWHCVRGLFSPHAWG